MHSVEYISSQTRLLGRPQLQMYPPVALIRNFESLNPKYEKPKLFFIFGGSLTSNPGLPNFQGSKTSSQRRLIHNKGKKESPVFPNMGPNAIREALGGP